MQRECGAWHRRKLETEDPLAGFRPDAQIEKECQSELFPVSEMETKGWLAASAWKFSLKGSLQDCRLQDGSAGGTVPGRVSGRDC